LPLLVVVVPLPLLLLSLLLEAAARGNCCRCGRPVVLPNMQGAA